MPLELFPILFLLGSAVARPLLERQMFNHTIGNIDIYSNATNSTTHINAASSWWYANLDHSTAAVRDYVPFLSTYDYPVYKSVSSGDASGFMNAIYSDGPNGNRDNMWLAGEPRVVYLSPGIYTLSSTLYLDTDTVIIGDAINPPTIKAASGFSGDFLIVGGQGEDNTAGGGESHFSVMIKNVILDTTQNSGDDSFTALSWRVAQNSALVNVRINMPQGGHTGIYMGQGSTISVADVTFYYGNIGLHYAGHQQAALKNMQFHYCTTGIQVDGGNTVVIQGPLFDTVGNSVVYNSGAPWVAVVDAISRNSGTFFSSTVSYPNFMLENISKDTTNSPVVIVNGQTKLSGQTSIGNYVYGNTYNTNPTYQTNPSVKSLSRSSTLAPSGSYPILTAPQYTNVALNGVINLKDSNANGGCTLHGDGSSDETSCLQQGLNTAASTGKIAYLPYGIYRVYNTITIPPGTRLVGNAWSTISGYGSAFTDESNPKAIVQVGAPGSSGTAVIQDMRFTVGQLLPGAIILQVNMAGKAAGDVAIFNSLITVGGTRDTSINCSDESNCRSAYTGLHLTSTSSAYIENFWSWLADHNSDGSSGSNFRTAGKGGILVEATKGTWLTGVGSEHWWLYNMNHHNAQNVFASLYQSETNYKQGNNAVVKPPAPFTAKSGDPTFSWCDNTNNCAMTVAQFYNGGSNIYEYGSGSWNFQSLDGVNQGNMNVIGSYPSTLRLYGLTDHDTTYIMRLPDGTRFGDGSNDGYGGSWGTLVAQYTH